MIYLSRNETSYKNLKNQIFIFTPTALIISLQCLANINQVSNTLATVRSSESRATDTTKTFTGESSLTGAIIQTRAATTRILVREKRNESEKSDESCGKLIDSLSVHCTSNIPHKCFSMDLSFLLV